MSLYILLYPYGLAFKLFLNDATHFNHHSMGAPTISSEQFATILLRHTQHDVQNVVQRLHSRPVPPTEVCGIHLFWCNPIACSYCAHVRILVDLPGVFRYWIHIYILNLKTM